MIPDLRNANDLESILAQFLPAADLIMREHDLVYEAGPPRQITELELYLWNTQGSWKDPWTDGACEQLNRGTWYVKTGAINRSRIDITAGNDDPQCPIWAGMLIRALSDQIGPSRALKSLVRSATPSSDDWTDLEAYRLCKINRSSIYDGPLQLRKCVRRQGTIYFGPRVFPKKTSQPEYLSYCGYKLRAATQKISEDFTEWRPR
jgi:hypothetical protein